MDPTHTQNPTAALAILITTFTVGGGLIVAYLLLGRTRSYLMYLGGSLLSFGFALLLPAGSRLIPHLLAAACLLMAIIEGVADTRARLTKFREEQHEREAAFGEFLEAVTRSDVKKEGTGPTKYEL